MMVHKIDNIGAYIRFLMQNPEETEILFKEIADRYNKFLQGP